MKTEIALTNQSATELLLDFYETNSKDYLLLLTGSHSSRARQADLVGAMIEATRLSVIVFAYTGFENDSKDYLGISPAQHFLEVIKVFDWAIEKFGRSPKVVVGGSYGGFMATQLTKYREFENLVLRAPAIYRPEDFYSPWQKLEEDEVAENRRSYRAQEQGLTNHPLLKRASEFQGNTLVVIHGADEVCPRNTTQAFADAFSAEIYEAEDFPHSLKMVNDKSKVEDYQKAISNWINTQTAS